MQRKVYDYSAYSYARKKRNNVKKRTRYETMRFIAVALICLLVGVLLYTNLHKSSKITLVAKKYYAQPGDQEDLISIGTIGLMKAVDTFDSTRKARFSTYASRCIENELRMYFRRERKNGGTVSLQETLEAGKDDTALTLSDVLQDGFCMEDRCEQQDEARRLRQLIEGLPARERKLILLRYGLAGQPPLTQLETAKLLQISRSYVSRLETHALALLREGWEQKTAQKE